MNRRVTPFGLRSRLRRLPGGDLIVKVVVFLLGAALIGLGVVLAVLPGPFTLPPVLLGLAVWSLEFAFAERLLHRARMQADAAWAAARARPWWTALISATAVGLAVGAALLLVKLDLVARARDAFG